MSLHPPAGHSGMSSWFCELARINVTFHLSGPGDSPACDKIQSSVQSCKCRAVVASAGGQEHGRLREGTFQVVDGMQEKLICFYCSMAANRLYREDRFQQKNLIKYCPMPDSHSESSSGFH